MDEVSTPPPATKPARLTDEQLAPALEKMIEALAKMHSSKAGQQLTRLVAALEKRSAISPLPAPVIAVLRKLRQLISPSPLSAADRAAGAAAFGQILSSAGTDDYASLRPAFDQLDRLRRNNSLRRAAAEVTDRLNGLIGDAPPIPGRANDAVGARASTDVQTGGPASGADWEKVLAHAQSISSTMPSKKWMNKASDLTAAVGVSWFIVIERWFQEVGKPSVIEQLGSMGEVLPPTVLNPASADLLKGLVWACAAAKFKPAIPLLGNLGVQCYQKIRNIGARSPKLGNACVNALATFDDPTATAELARLQSKAKSASTRAAIAKAFDALRKRTGMSFDDLFEISLPAHTLSHAGTREIQFDDVSAKLSLVGNSEASLLWTNAQGKPVKAVPASVKRDHGVALKELQRSVKDLSALLATVVTRVEKQLLFGRTWPIEVWQKRYMEHPVAWQIGRNLIWNFGRVTAIFFDGGWVDASGKAITLPVDTHVTLWHPIHSTTDEVRAWRNFLEQHEIVQPFKQAHREIYVLTDAERTTGTYSNRFAAHVLRQHQFNALCLQRGWVYRLQGAFDSHNTPTLNLPALDLKVEFTVEGVDSETSGSGIYLHVASDQLRFLRNHAPVALEQIPPRVLSEIMRDVDLFVGVTSMGNDPTWQDSGPFQTYWRDYSFGELSATAATRHDVLSRLISRLKIADRCSLTDRFLVVRGNLRTYKIHLGSSNILMEPNDQYLCIVPSHGRETLFLPFEGDRTLSAILSKAFLLSADDKIKDPTITSQIKR